MKRQKLLRKRVLALAISTAMVFAQADTYAVLAAGPENSGEAVEYDESRSVLNEDLETDEPGAGNGDGTDEATDGTNGETDGTDGATDSTNEATDGSDGTMDGSDGTTDGSGGTTDGSDGTTDGSDGTTDGSNGATDGSDGTTDGTDGTTDGSNGATDGSDGTTDGSDGGSEPNEGEDSGTKQAVTISPVTIADKTYDGNAVSYTGTLEVKDSDRNLITDVITNCSYTGTLADGSEYTDVTKAPSLAGNYTLTVTISESDKYTAEAVTCSFEITRKAITITTPSLSIYTGEALPALSSLKATVDGLLSGDTVLTQFKYGTDNISTKEEGTYDIIPFDADAGNNYSITYVNGTLTITKAEVVHEGAGKNNKLTWTIDESGKLTVKGTGNYPTMKWGEDEEYDGDIVPEWHQWAESITSAEISVSGITTTENMFYECCNLKSIDLTNLNTSKVTNMTWMFYGCNALETLDLTNLNTSKVTSMNSMFADCNALETLDVSGFNTSKVKSMSFMFDSCNSLKTLDVSSFNTGNVTDMIAMFRFCSSLTDLDLSSFNTSKVKYMFEMFMG